MMTLTNNELIDFAKNLKTINFKNNFLQIGSFLLKTHKIKNDGFKNFSGKDLFDFNLQFQTKINGQILKFYIQLYENITSSGNKHFRLASYIQADSTTGMIFTLNLSKQKDELGQLSLTSKLTFTQQPDGHKDLATSHRKLKQYLFAEILNNMGYDITDNNNILFGIYDLKAKQFLNTSPEKFLNDFLVVSILKGHFMANKGYEIELFPSFKNINPEFKSFENEIKTTEQLPTVIKDLRAKRAIPLSLRFKVLHRDKSTCLKCGKTPNDGIKLHIDHITPYSKGGLTVFNNLRTLCNECNIGRSNKYID
jgi:hypothetical protein